MNILPKKWTLLFAAAITAIVLAWTNAFAQQRYQPSGDTNANPLSDIHLRDKALVVVLKSSVVSADDTDNSIIDSVLRADPYSTVRHHTVYWTLARKLNSYIRKHKSLSAATDISEADFVIFFSLVEYRRILNEAYPFGELYVIAKGEPQSQRPPRIIWKSNKIMWAGDAVSNFLKDLKNIRGED